MPVVGDEAHRRLARTREIKDGHTRPILERSAELIQTVTLSRLGTGYRCLSHYRLVSPALAAAAGEDAPAEATACGFRAAAGTAAGLGASARTMSMLPLKKAPSSITIRAVRMSPTTLA